MTTLVVMAAAKMQNTQEHNLQTPGVQRVTSTDLEPILKTNTDANLIIIITPIAPLSLTIRDIKKTEKTKGNPNSQKGKTQKEKEKSQRKTKKKTNKKHKKEGE